MDRLLQVNNLFPLPKNDSRSVFVKAGLLSFLLMFFWQFSSSAQSYSSDAEIGMLIDRAIVHFHQGNYQDGIEICEQLMDKYPENPIGYLGAATIYYGIMKNYWINTYTCQFDSLITLGISKGRRAVEENHQNAECHFLYGAALGIRGLHRIQVGDWIGAFRDGLLGYRNVKRSYALNDQIYDAYYGLGLFYYWKSAKIKALSFLRFMKDEREKGITFIKTAIEKGRFSAMEGRFTLVEIYYHEGRFEEAYTHCLYLKDKFSDDPTWLYLMAKLFEEQQQWEEAINYYQTLLSKLTRSPYPKSAGFTAACYQGMAKCAYAQGNDLTAIELNQIALRFALLRNENAEIDGPLHSFHDILQQIEDLNLSFIKR